MFLDQLTGRSSGAFFLLDFIILLTVSPDGIKYSSVRSKLLIEIVVFGIKAP